MVMLKIGVKIKELRQANQLTQKSLAEKLNVTPQAVSKWERNESVPDIQTLLNISTLFNVTVDDILGIEKPSLFTSLLKRKGRIKMQEKTTVVQTETLNGDSKKVIIFDMPLSLISNDGLLQTQLFATKLSNLFKHANKNILVETVNSSKVKNYAESANVLLLAPPFSSTKEKIEAEYPNIPIFSISQKDYGTLNVEDIYKEIIAVLQ